MPIPVNTNKVSGEHELLIAQHIMYVPIYPNSSPSFKCPSFFLIICPFSGKR